jgi:uncharacterized protein (TIGR02145 family)
MKKNLLLMMLYCPMVLAAQNGVTVSNLAVDAGTVTFNVSWNRDAMPVALWSDTVWVFVDYNKNGVMERLPVTDATASAGTVTKIPNNDKGVWVAGNARTQGSFSATVKLLTAVKNVGGACAYASNYPPVGKYSSASEIACTGTPMYDIQLVKPGGGTATVKSGDTFLLPCNYTLMSFTDATRAPGIMEELCTAPGSTVNFTAFNPCSNATTGDYWYLTDTREAAYGNTQTYKVKKMADGRIWLVQDMKFGNKCANNSFNSGSSDSQSKVSSVFTDFYGNCTAATNTNTPSNRGYLYDWAAAVNKSGAYYGGSYQGCSGTTTAANMCQGICPVGWHIPTGNSTGEYYDLHNNYGRGCPTGNDASCWDATSDLEGVIGGFCTESGSLGNQGSSSQYWSSTYSGSGSAYRLLFYGGSASPGTSTYSRHYGFSVRCVRNY